MTAAARTINGSVQLEAGTYGPVCGIGTSPDIAAPGRPAIRRRAAP